MMVLDSIKLVFEFPYHRVLSVHLLIGAAPVFVELVDYECRVAIHHEAFNTKLYVYTEIVQCRLVLHDIRCPKVDPKDRAKLVPGWRDEVYTCPSAVEV